MSRSLALTKPKLTSVHIKNRRMQCETIVGPQYSCGVYINHENGKVKTRTLTLELNGKGSIELGG